MENKSHAFWAGLFTIGLAIAIALTVFWFNVDRSVRIPYDLIARTNVTGLFTDAAVRYRGLDVGKVQSIHFDRQHPGQIVIRILVDKTAPITHSTYGSLGFQGVTGIAFVQLEDTGRNLTPFPSSAKQVAQIPMRPGLLDQLQERGDVLMRELESVAKHADNMMSDDMRDQLKATLASLQGAADNVSVIAKQASPAMSKLPGTLDQLSSTLASTNALISHVNGQNGPLVTNLNKIGDAADRASAALTTMNASLQDTASRVNYETLPRVDALTSEVGSAVRSVDRAADLFSTSPRSVLFGAPAPTPGPGEPGFNWPQSAASH
ncbi:MCE family protein [Trinickia terrae]|uniref:MCE family protein n=1 Tax=Trinickia terrae TaxID=2571161 RepID=A0A4U1I7X5_9BURK|nr:MlaD family protein [Trinickia terrae]TKC89532.1 MCE family protein [Trinickia terrae]